MGWLILGGLLLLVGLYNSLWSMWGLTFEKEDPWNDRRLYVVIARALATAFGALLVSFNFPDIMHGVSSPGWLIGGVLLFVCCGFAWWWKQFDPLLYSKNGEEYDTDYGFGFFFCRFIGMIVAIICISVGIGTGVPDWEPVNPAETPPAVEEPVQEEQ